MRLKGGKSAPFLMAPETSIWGTGWMFKEGHPIPKYYADWDPATDIEVFRDVTLDADTISESCHIDPSSNLNLGVLWVGSSTRIRGHGSLQTFTLGDGDREFRVTASVPGESVGRRLDLVTVLTLQDGLAVSPLGAERNGDVLWSDRQSMILEGEASRFPVNVVDFRATPGLESESFWFISWPSRDLTEPFGASMRLLINSRNQNVVKAVSTDSDTEDGAAVRRHIQMDVARGLLEFGFGSQEFLEGHEQYEEGSVGRAILELMWLCWGPGVEPAVLKLKRDEEPQKFESVLQAKLMAGLS